MEEAVTNISKQACARCYDVRYARLRLDLSAEQIRLGQSLFANWDHVTFGEAERRGITLDWLDAVSHLMPLVRDAASGQPKDGMNPGHYAAFRNYRNRPDVKTAAYLRAVLSRVLNSGGKDMSFYHGKLDCQKICFCSHAALVAHIESQFEPWMQWYNQGRKGEVWHLDHIYPVSRAIKEGTEQYVNHWRNLRPLAGPENQSKSDNVTPEITAYWQNILTEFQ